MARGDNNTECSRVNVDGVLVCVTIHLGKLANYALVTSLVVRPELLILCKRGKLLLF